MKYEGSMKMKTGLIKIERLVPKERLQKFSKRSDQMRFLRKLDGLLIIKASKMIEKGMGIAEATLIDEGLCHIKGKDIYKAKISLLPLPIEYLQSFYNDVHHYKPEVIVHLIKMWKDTNISKYLVLMRLLSYQRDNQIINSN